MSYHVYIIDFIHLNSWCLDIIRMDYFSAVEFSVVSWFLQFLQPCSPTRPKMWLGYDRYVVFRKFVVFGVCVCGGGEGGGNILKIKLTWYLAFEGQTSPGWPPSYRNKIPWLFNDQNIAVLWHICCLTNETNKILIPDLEEKSKFPDFTLTSGHPVITFWCLCLAHAQWGQHFFINWFTGNFFEILGRGGGGGGGGNIISEIDQSIKKIKLQNFD